MNLTTVQVKQLLRIGDTKLQRLVDSGELPTVAPRPEGKKKWFKQFDSRVVESWRKENSERLKVMQERHLSLSESSRKAPHSVLPVKGTSEPISGIRTQLARIENKLDTLIQLWS